MFSLSHYFCLADGGHKIFIESLVADLETLAIEILVLEENDYLFRSDSSL